MAGAKEHPSTVTRFRGFTWISWLLIRPRGRGDLREARLKACERSTRSSRTDLELRAMIGTGYFGKRDSKLASLPDPVA